MINIEKNRIRDEFSFANINLLGKCNADCYFCLGKDIEDKLNIHNQLQLHYTQWKNFITFLNKCNKESIKKIYITGQNTDSLLYMYLNDLIDYLHAQGFQVGLRTNGYTAYNKIDIINKCDLSVGYSIHTLNPITNKMMIGRIDIPNWNDIIPVTKNPRVQIVLNRCNEFEFFDILKYLSTFKNIRYVQIRRVSTDTRAKFLEPDIAAYEHIYTQVSKIFSITRKFVTDAEEYNIYGLPVVFWRTIKTSANSINYFTDGTISDDYFIVEGYLKNYQNEKQ
jgi:MoaA/NifB/PqqE/SkfB family radical SAM enzyme